MAVTDRTCRSADASLCSPRGGALRGRRQIVDLFLPLEDVALVILVPLALVEYDSFCPNETYNVDQNKFDLYRCR